MIGSTIKSGTNEFHGNVFEYWRDSSMAANTWDNNRVTPAAKKPELSQHIFGATIGGPLVKNKVFFFADYQGFIRDRPGELVRTVAPEAWRRGDFSGVAVAIRDPLTGQPFPGNTYPDRPVQPDRAGGPREPDPLSAAQPAGRHQQPGRAVLGQSDERTRATSRSTRTCRTTIACSRASRTRSTSRSRSGRPLESNLIATNDSPFLGLAFNWTRTLGASALNELLVGFTHVKFQTIPTDWAGIGNANATVGIPGGQTIAGLSAFDIGDFGFGDAGGRSSTTSRPTRSPRSSRCSRAATLKFGGRWLYQRQGFAYSGNEGILGHFEYTGAFTGFAFADFLLDQCRPRAAAGWWSRSRTSGTASASSSRTTSGSATTSR